MVGKRIHRNRDVESLEWLNVFTNKPKSVRFNNLYNQKFGRLTVTEFFLIDRRKTYQLLLWKCRCDCGNIVAVASNSLKKGTSSCGCLNRESITKSIRTNRYTGNTYLSGKVISQYLKKSNKNSGSILVNEFTSLVNEIGDSQNGCCNFCGIQMKTRTTVKDVKSGKDGVTVDRINSDLPYQSGNIQLLCWRCNEMKKNESDKEFLDRIRRIYEYNNLGAKLT